MIFTRVTKYMLSSLFLYVKDKLEIHKRYILQMKLVHDLATDGGGISRDLGMDNTVLMQGSR
mgnify:CR=1 FL=1